MAVEVPYKDWLRNPIQWTARLHQVEVGTDGSPMSVSEGFKRFTYEATLAWVLEATEAASLLNQIEAADCKNVWLLNDVARGQLTIRVNGAPTYDEWKVAGPRRFIVTVPVRYSR